MPRGGRGRGRDRGRAVGQGWQLAGLLSPVASAGVADRKFNFMPRDTKTKPKPTQRQTLFLARGKFQGGASGEGGAAGELHLEKTRKDRKLTFKNVRTSLKRISN